MPDVAALQVGLRANGVYDGPIDGLIGPLTIAAIRELERQAGLPVTGVATARVRAALGAYARTSLGTRVLRPSISGWDVAKFQFLLAWQGFPSGPTNGLYSERTAAAVRRFQRFARLAVDGVAGPATIAAAGAAPPRAPLVLSRPLDAAPSGSFGPRGDGFHSGIDYAAPAGTLVRAAASGRVTFAGWHPAGWGYLVTIAHGNRLRSMSAHLSRITVSVGDRVSRGVRIGAVGSSGNSSGPHLHFELRFNGAAVDPLTALRG